MSLPLLHAGRTNPGLSAALDLRFALDKSLTAYRGPTPSFSRASTGSYFDGSGVLRYAAVNILTYSEDLTNAAWVNQNTTDSGNATISPDGKTTADSLIESATNSSHLIYQQANVTSGTIYTFSVYLKANQRSFAYIQMADSSSPNKRFSALINISNGTIVTTRSLNSPTNTSSSISDAGNGWYRASITMSQSGGSIIYAQVAISDSSTPTYDAADLPTYSGNISNGIYIWGAQLEASSTVGTYCPTTSSANSAPRFNHTYNGTSWVSRGLLVEEQRTNSSPYSVTFNSGNAPWGMADLSISLNSATAPDGTNTATKLIDNVANSNHNIYRQISFSGTITFSVFAKAAGRNYVQIFIGNLGSPEAGINVDLTNGTITNQSPSVVASGTQDVGNGWYRIWFSATGAGGIYYPAIATSNAATGIRGVYTGDGSSGVYIWGAQWESGSFPTSYIGNSGSGSTTRSTDVCQITGGDFSGFWNGTEGAIAYEADSFSNSQDNQVVFQASDGTLNNQYQSARSQNNAYTDIGFWVKTGNVWQSLIATSSGAWNQNLPNKNAMAYKINDFAFSNSGATVLTDTSGTLPNVDRINIGASVTSAGSLNGHIARLRYYRKRLPNATLQLLSEPDPTLNLQFALNKSLTPVAGPAPSFSRASTGSYFDSTGTLKYANVNLLLQSEAFSTSPWSNLGLPTITTNTDISPDGKQTADTINDSSTGSFWGVSQTISVTSGATYTFSIYIKKTFVSPTSYPLIQIQVGASSYSALIFNTFNGSISVVTGGSYVAPASYQSVEISGYWRVSITAVINTSSPQMQFYPAGSSDGSTISSAATGSAVVWGAQLEASSTASTYIPTTSAANSAPRFDHVYSGGQWVSRGLLLEEQRTNLCLWSGDMTQASWTKQSAVTVTGNASSWVDGTNASQRINYPANSSYKSIYRSFTGTAAAYTASVYAKAGTVNWLGLGCVGGNPQTDGAFFNLSNGTIGTTAAGVTAAIQNCGDGWYRCAVMKTHTAATSYIQIEAHTEDNQVPNYTSNGTETIFVAGAQVELGSFPTSYIPTTTSSVTRSADVCQITGTSFGSMWNQGEGSVVAEYDRLANNSSGLSGGYPTTFSASSSNSLWMVLAGSIAPSPVGEVLAVYDTTSQAYFTAGSSPLAGIVAKMSACYKSNDFAASLNGSAVSTDTSGTVPVCNQIGIGYWPYGNAPVNGHIAKLIYYPARLTNTKLQQLST